MSRGVVPLGHGAGEIAGPWVGGRGCLDHNTYAASSLSLLGTGRAGMESPAANLIEAYRGGRGGAAARRGAESAAQTAKGNKSSTGTEEVPQKL